MWREGKDANACIDAIGEPHLRRLPPPAICKTPVASSAWRCRTLTPQQRKQLDLKGGVLVGGVDGAAARAGIQEGDVLIAVNGEQIESSQQFKTLGGQGAGWQAPGTADPAR